MTDTTAPPRRKRRWLPIVGALITTAALGAVAYYAISLTEAVPGESSPTALRKAHDACRAGEISDQDRTIFLDLSGTDYNTGDLNASNLLCVLDALNTPDSVIRMMESTRALDGHLSKSWGPFEASWTYHPDDGLDVIITESQG